MPPIWTDIYRFFHSDLWNIRLARVSRGKAMGVMFLRVVFLTLSGFTRHNWPAHAAGLTYYSLVSVVPILALAFGIAQGFGFEKTVTDYLNTTFAGHEEAVGQVVEFSHRLLDSVQGGLIAGVGLVLLFWAVFRVLGFAESAFNQIWGVKRQRSWGRKFVDYLAVTIFGAIFLLISSGLTVFITSEIRGVINSIEILGPVSPFLSSLLRLAPFWIIWAMMTFIYLFLPHTKVNFLPALLAGIVAGTAFQFFQGFYIHLQIVIAKYNAIYGSFSALPLFLFWLNISWLIILFGSELAAAFQNVESYEYAPERFPPSHSSRRMLAVRIVYLLIDFFKQGRPEADLARIARELDMPTPIVGQAIEELIKAGLVSPVPADDETSTVFQPAVDTDILTIGFVIEAWERAGGSPWPKGEKEADILIERQMENFYSAAQNSGANKRLKDL